jgi:hypothetical protein
MLLPRNNATATATAKISTYNPIDFDTIAALITTTTTTTSSKKINPLSNTNKNTNADVK